MPELELSVGEFVALFNQTLEYAYPSVIISGELANFHISKNKWLYFDLKDNEAVVHCFGSVYQLPGPLEDGMLLRIKASPRLHPLYGFSLNTLQIQLSGEGTIKRASEILAAKLTAEGLFDPARKRTIAYPPDKVGLITSVESAAYSDFIKVLSERWGGIEISMIDVQVQGQLAPEQIVQAIESFNQSPEPPDVLIVIRGGGSADDLQAFSTEQVTRAVAASRIPTMVAIGHERDISLAELAADLRASTPSNAAQLLVPDRDHTLRELATTKNYFNRALEDYFDRAQKSLVTQVEEFYIAINRAVVKADEQLVTRRRLLELLSPQAVLTRGYAVVHNGLAIVRSVKDVKKGDILDIQLVDGQLKAMAQGK
jgi:exodeoxyribonuclease VII large subunit